MFKQNRIYRLFQLINYIKANPAKSVRSIETLLGIRSIPNSTQYYFKANVQSFKAPGRFVMGFLEDIQMIGSIEFKRYIKRIVSKST